MISCDVLERPHASRGVIAIIILAAAFAPALPLFWEALSEGASASALDASFWSASVRSFAVAIAVVAAALLLGVPTGVLAGLYEFRGRRLLLALLGVPLIVPSFLCAIGLSQLRIELGLSSESVLSGFAGTVLAFLCWAVPLVIFITLAAVRRLSKRQIEAARI